MLALFAASALAQSPEHRVLLVVNDDSPLSRSVAEYYARARLIPPAQIARLRTTSAEEIDHAYFDAKIARPIAQFLRARNWSDRIHYIVTTAGIPLKIRGQLGMGGDAASVDSELAALYLDIKGARPHRTGGSIPNPFFRSSEPFSHPKVPMYLVTRLAGYDFPGIRALIDRSLEARNRGTVAIDLRGDTPMSDGDLWLQTAANRLPSVRVRLETGRAVLSGLHDVIAYASWGSNDRNQRTRSPGFTWLPGSIAIQFVSSDGRTFERPPAGWKITTFEDKANFFAGSPQSLTADLLREGASGASGHVYEPFLEFAPRPQFVLPAYMKGDRLADSFYRGIPAISWRNIVIGDPLCQLQP